MLSTVCLVSFVAAAVAQEWGEQNPNQPNGYRASEFNSHYHGNLNAPEYQPNGYRASEARSHYGGERYEPSSGWSYQENSGPGSAFSSAPIANGGPGSAFSNASWYQNGGSQNTFVERMRRANRWQQGFKNLEAAGYTGAQPPCASPNGADCGGYQSFRSRMSTFEPLIQREQSWRQGAIERVEDGQAGFGRIYAQP